MQLYSKDSKTHLGLVAKSPFPIKVKPRGCVNLTNVELVEAKKAWLGNDKVQ